ncbi:MAG TPA: hypothetical protein VHW65_05180, partial [Gemmatimonadales bacterium]|nr:hypothetical protein [Gemmatimonadales bacterium]
MHWSVLVFAIFAPTQRPDSAALSTLIHRVEQGDAAARKQLEAIARPLSIDAAQERPDLPTARTLARVAFTLAQPTSDLDSALTHREQEWREPAVRALRYTLAADSGDSWAATALEQIAPYPYIWLPVGKELQQLRALAARHADLTSTLASTRIRLEIETGSLDSAATLLSRLTA